MKHTHIFYTGVFITLLAVMNVSAWFVYADVTSAAIADPALMRRAERMQARLVRRNLPSASIETLAKALQERNRLLRQRADVEFVDSETGTGLTVWSVSFHTNPTWLTYDAKKAVFTVNEQVIQETIQIFGVPSLKQPNHVEATRVIIDSVPRVDTNNARAVSGWTYDAQTIAKHIAEFLSHASGTIKVSATETLGTIRIDGKELTLLGTGHSDFSTSLHARAVNVKKSISNIHNAIIEPGEVFSYNDILDYPIASSNGWPNAKVIFGGWELRDAPGGGICQGSTTVFRSALYAGLPILIRKSHSLYVHYYEKHGVGLDATVFPGQQDFTFLNDTAGPLVLQAYTDGFDGYVHVYGIPDGRTVTLEGPYFAPNAPHDLLVNGRALRSTEIAWIRHVYKKDGVVQSESLISRYNSIPSSVIKKYTQPTIASGQ